MPRFFYSKHVLFAAACVFFILGIFFASFFYPPAPWVYASLAAAAVLCGVGSVFGSRKTAVFGMLGIAFLFGVLRLQVSQVPSEYAEEYDAKTDFQGIVVEDPDIRSGQQLLTIRPFGKSQNVLVSARLQDRFFYGDWVSVTGKIQEPKNFDDFDYERYLQRFGVYAVMSYPRVLILKNHHGAYAKEFLLRIKHAFTDRVSMLLPEPQASLLLGILIGAKKTLPQSVIDDFNATGTSHVIAVSGFNISIVIGSLAFLAYVLGRRWHFWFCFAFIAAFVIVAGASASVIRAAIMGGMSLFALRVGRQYAVVGSLLFAAFIMLALNPKIAYTDIGFQLSFAATLGIVLAVPLLKKIDEESSWFGVKDTLITTLAAIVATLPLIMFYFGTVSLVAPVVNILILPVLVPYAMLVGFCSVLPFVGTGFAYVANLLLTALLSIVHFFARLPFAAIQFKISTAQMVLMYALLAAVYLYARERLKD